MGVDFKELIVSSIEFVFLINLNIGRILIKDFRGLFFIGIRNKEVIFERYKLIVFMDWKIGLLR